MGARKLHIQSTSMELQLHAGAILLTANKVYFQKRQYYHFLLQQQNPP
jgi:hypothetical protein